LGSADLAIRPKEWTAAASREDDQRQPEERDEAARQQAKTDHGARKKGGRMEKKAVGLRRAEDAADRGASM
jgi:hypothetical protein